MTATQNPTTAAPEAGAVLLPCPFCGGTDGDLVQGFTRATDDFAFWSVECVKCGAEIASDTSQAEADEHWNTRLAAQAQPTPSRGESGAREAVTRIVYGFFSIRDEDPKTGFWGPVSWERIQVENYDRAKRCFEAADAILALPELSTPIPTGEVLREALEWYAEHVRDCRKIGSIGDAARHALDRDGGERARNALAMGGGA